MARIKYAIVLAPDAVRELRELRAYIRARVADAIEAHLSFEPHRTSRSRIKKLRGSKRPQYRLRVDDIRVFYDVGPRRVEILAILPKERAYEWLESTRLDYEEGSGREGEG